MVIDKIKLNKSLVWFSVLLSVCLVITPSGVMATTLYLMPQSQTFYQDDSFILELKIDTEGQEINVAGIDLTFSKDSLEFIDFNKGGSLLSLWAKEPEISAEKISFIGGAPGGFNGQGLIGRIIFKAKKISQTRIDFEDSCQVLLNDGQGTSASLTFLEGNYEIIERPKDLPQIFANTHPNQYQWSKSNTLHLHWDLIEGAEYSYLLSQDPLAKPDNIPDKPKGELAWTGDMEYAGLEDGIYYFTLRQKLPVQDWSEKASYRVMIDAVAPEEFSLEIAQDPSLFEGKYFLSFAAADKTSGIDYYEIKEGKGDFRKAKSPYLIKDQSLTKKIIVRAYDKAGNEKIAEYLPPERPFPWQIIILILAVIGIIWLIIKRISAKPRKSLA